VGALGGDLLGREIIRLSEESGLDMRHCHIGDGRSPVYMAILDKTGEMALALSDMVILNEMPISHLQAKASLIGNAELIVVDANFPEAVIEYILDSNPDKKVFVDPVSVGKARNVKRLIHRFDTVKTNLMEAEYLSGISVADGTGIRRVGDWFIKKGVRRVFITIGPEGVYYQTRDEQGMFPGLYINPVNVTGAGDAFMAGIVYCSLFGRNNMFTARFACAASRIALASESTVSPDLNTAKVLEEMRREED
jgi:pseudouridine kinase